MTLKTEKWIAMSYLELKALRSLLLCMPLTKIWYLVSGS